MTASTRDQSPETADAAPGVRVRRMEDVDLERILELRTAVRWSADPGAFGLLRGMGEARWAVAEAEEVPGALVGMVGAVPLGETGILCHLAVHGDYRRMGLGAGLTGWALSYLRSRGVRRFRLDSTGEAEGLYRSLGFVPVARRSVYRLEGTGYRARETPPEPGGCRVSPLAARDLPEVYGADRWSTGADRSALILATLRLHPGGGLVARDRSGAVKGYLIQSLSDRGVRMGPFLAESPGTARHLISRALAEGGGPVEVTVPGGGPAHHLLTELGFEGREDRLRMELGGPGEPRPAVLEEYATTPYLAT